MDCISIRREAVRSKAAVMRSPVYSAGGAAAAVLGVITVPIVAILLVATVLMQFWNSPTMVNVFNGVRVAVAAVITSAVVKLVRANVKNWLGIALCVVGFVIISILHLSPVFVVLLAIVVGLVLWGVRK